MSIVHGRPSSSARALQNVGPLPRDRREVGGRGHDAVVEGAPRAPDQLGDGRLEPRDVGHEAGVASRLGIEADGGERGAEAVGQVGDALALGRPQLVDAVGQHVQRPGGVGQLGRGAGLGPGVSLAGGQRPGRARQLGGVAGHRAGQAVGNDDRRGHQHDGDPRKRQPGRAHPVVQQPVGDRGPDDRHTAVTRHDRGVERERSVDLLAEGPTLVPGELERRVLGGTGVANHRAIGQPHGDAPVGTGAGAVDGGGDQLRRDRGKGEGRGQRCHVTLGRGDGAVPGDRPHERPERQREGDDDEAGGGQHHEHDAAAHGASAVAVGRGELHADTPHCMEVGGCARSLAQLAAEP